MAPDKLKQIVEAALLAADEPLTLDRLVKLFRAEEVNAENIRSDIREALQTLAEEAAGRGYELKRVASGFRYQVRQELSTWISRLWEEKPPRYSRALLETLALVAYKQPVTRADIEQVRGVSVSQSIMRTLLERGWIRVVGQREVPGRPVMYGTTRAFLDYFNLKSLDQLPPLAEIRELIEPLLEESAALDESVIDAAAGSEAAPAAQSSAEPQTAAAQGAAESEPESAAESAAAGIEVAEAEGVEEETAERPARVVEVVTELEEAPEQTEGEQRSAEVVRLPTSPQSR